MVTSAMFLNFELSGRIGNACKYVGLHSNMRHFDGSAARPIRTGSGRRCCSASIVPVCNASDALRVVGKADRRRRRVQRLPGFGEAVSRFSPPALRHADTLAGQIGERLDRTVGRAPSPRSRSGTRGTAKSTILRARAGDHRRARFHVDRAVLQQRNPRLAGDRRHHQLDRRAEFLAPPPRGWRARCPWRSPDSCRSASFQP